MRQFHIVFLLLAVQPIASDGGEAPAPASTAGLPLHVPANFRAKFVHLGSWVVADKTAPGHGFHDVYTEPHTLAEYRKSSRFPDGATLIKEIRTVASGALTTGQASWAATSVVWFVMVKDSRGRYRNSPLWGDGWLWALYKADSPTRNIASSYKSDCQGCHLPAAGTDRVFIQGYPTLGLTRRAAPQL